MPVAYDAVSGTTSIAMNPSWSHTAGTLTDGIVFVWAYWCDTDHGDYITGGSYDGTAMTNISLWQPRSGNTMTLMYRLLGNSTSGSKTVSLTSTGGGMFGYLGCITYQGVQQSASPWYDTDMTNEVLVMNGSLTTTCNVNATGHVMFYIERKSGGGCGNTPSGSDTSRIAVVCWDAGDSAAHYQVRDQLSPSGSTESITCYGDYGNVNYGWGHQLSILPAPSYGSGPDFPIVGGGPFGRQSKAHRLQRWGYS